MAGASNQNPGNQNSNAEQPTQDSTHDSQAQGSNNQNPGNQNPNAEQPNQDPTQDPQAQGSNNQNSGTEDPSDRDSKIKDKDLCGRIKDLWRQRLRPLFSLLFGVLWLAPAVALLVLNFKGHIVGAGLGCKGSGCRIDPFSTNQVAQAQKLDKRNHNILGVLLIVAKALEVWFTLIAASLVYNIAIRLAKKERLPMRMLTMYIEFPGIDYLKQIFGNLSSRTSPGIPLSNCLKFWILIFVAALCLVINLMGTATGVLILPTLQWMNINRQNSIVFGELQSSSAPSSASISPFCTTDMLAAGNYSCTYYPYGKTLDELVANAVSSNQQADYRHTFPLPSVSQEAALTFTFNLSESTSTIWVPSRQLIRDFSVDLGNYYSSTFSNQYSQTYPDSARFNQSLQVQLQRKGPAIGIMNDCVLGEPTVFNVSTNKEVHCFPMTRDVKCIRWGSGWGVNVSLAHFTILDGPPDNRDLVVDVYATQQAAYLSVDSCFNDGSCDWNSVFSTTPIPNNRNISSSQLSFVYSMQNTTLPKGLCNTASYLSFANYILNPSQVDNILNLVQLEIIDGSPSGPPNYNISAIANIHSDWLLMAWSADHYNPVPPARPAASTIITAFQFWAAPNSSAESAENFNSIHQYTVLQALSLIPYTTNTANNPDESKVSTLNSGAAVQLWKYDLGARTPKLGVAIIIIGCVCVLLRTAFYVDFPESRMSPTEVVIAALINKRMNHGVDPETGDPVNVTTKSPIYKHFSWYPHHNNAIEFNYPSSLTGNPVAGNSSQSAGATPAGS